MKNRKFASYCFAISGFIFLLISAVQYLSGQPTDNPFAAIGIIMVAISLAIRNKKVEDK